MKFLRTGRGPAEMPFLDHLEELRWRILWSLLAIAVGTIIGFVLVTRFNVLELLINPIKPYVDDDRLGYLSPADPFMVSLGLALTVGFILAFPIVVAQVWAFISPALHKNEKRAIVPALYMGLLLFIGGVALAYYVVLPMTFKFFAGFQTGSLRQQIVIGPYISLVVKVLVGFGVVFELPVVILILSALGIVTSKFLAEKRRYAVAGSAITAALLTPGDAVTVTVFMMGPLILLYEMSIGLARLMERRRAKAKLSEPVAAAILLLLLATPALGQQAPPTPPRSPRELVLEKLRTMGKEAPRDTSAQADSLAQLARRDSVRAAQRSVVAPASLALDSVMRALLQLEGFTATQYKAAAASFKADSGILILRAIGEEKATVVQAAQSLVADTMVTYDRNTSIACGFGRPVLSGEGTDAPVESQRVCYNTRTREGTAIGATTRMTEGANWIVTADLSTRETDLYGRHARFTDCTEARPHYHFSAGSIKVINNDVMVARNVTLNFQDVPVFWLPFMMQSLKQGRRSGILMPRFSVNDIVRRSSRYNRRIENVGFYWATSEHVGTQLTLDWFSNNWTALNGSMDYRWLNHFLSGQATYRQFWPTEGTGTQFTVATNNSWQPNERTSLGANLMYSSDSRFIRDRSYDPRELNRSIDSHGGVQRRFDWGSVNMQLSRREFLTDGKVDLVMPSLGISLSSVTLFPATGTERWFNNATWTGNAQTRFTSSGVEEDRTPEATDRRQVTVNASSGFNIGRFSWSQSVNLDESKQNARAASGDSILALPEVNRQNINWTTGLNFQQRLIGTSTFTPGLTMSGQFAKDSLGQRVSAPTRLAINASINTDLFGFWPGVASIERFRHRLSPTFSYSYSPTTRPDSLQMRVFGGAETLEQNRLTIGLSQTIEGKYREKKPEPGDSTAPLPDSMAADTMVSTDPNQPRRLPQSQKLMLLSLNTTAVVYDFVRARDGYGIETPTISNSINSDLLRGLQLSIVHDLFRVDSLPTGAPPGTRPDRSFAPHLSQMSASFSLTGSSWLFRALGLAGGGSPEAPPATGSTPTPVPSGAEAGPPTDPSRSELGLMGTRGSGPDAAPAPRSATGSWNASLNYTLSRPRQTATVNVEGNQMVQASMMFQPTQMWNVSWNTGYSFTESNFTDHVLTLTRMLHDWDANFDFVKAQNGNFSFQFRVALRANQDIKFDYQQRTNNTDTRLR